MTREIDYSNICITGRVSEVAHGLSKLISVEIFSYLDRIEPDGLEERAHCGRIVFGVRQF